MPDKIMFIIINTKNKSINLILCYQLSLESESFAAAKCVSQMLLIE